jgi:hypothetical protein
MHYNLLMKYLFYFILLLPWETDQVGTDTETGAGTSGNC